MGGEASLRFSPRFWGCWSVLFPSPTVVLVVGGGGWGGGRISVRPVSKRLPGLDQITNCVIRDRGGELINAWVTLRLESVPEQLSRVRLAYQ